jgi:hypothetical protein
VVVSYEPDAVKGLLELVKGLEEIHYRGYGFYPQWAKGSIDGEHGFEV